jgi:hypothetical protein
MIASSFSRKGSPEGKEERSFFVLEGVPLTTAGSSGRNNLKDIETIDVDIEAAVEAERNLENTRRKGG